jgi:hypothetical protein
MEGRLKICVSEKYYACGQDHITAG